MSAPVTLGLFAAGLAVVFGASTAVGAAVGPVGPVGPPPAVVHGPTADHRAPTHP